MPKSPKALSSKLPKTEIVAGGAFLNPAALAFVFVLLLNDHWLKRAFPGFVTGKLSDVAGLAFFPLLLQSLWEIGHVLARRRWRPSRRALWISIALTAIVFSLVKTWEPASELYRIGLGSLQWPFLAAASVLAGADIPPIQRVALVRDPSDLLALPALGIAAWIGSQRLRYGPAMTPSEKNIVKSLVAVAWADGTVKEPEQGLIDGLLWAFGASDEDETEIREWAKKKRTLDADLPLDELGKTERELLLAHAALLTHADGKQTKAEEKLLSKLCEKLEISDADAKPIIATARERAKKLAEKI